MWLSIRCPLMLIVQVTNCVAKSQLEPIKHDTLVANNNLEPEPFT